MQNQKAQSTALRLDELPTHCNDFFWQYVMTRVKVDRETRKRAVSDFIESRLKQESFTESILKPVVVENDS